MLYGFFNFVLRILLAILTRRETVGLENVPPTGALIIIGNHTSFLDPLLLGVAIPRRTVFMSKAENFRHPLLAPLVWLYGAFPVRRGMVDRRALKRSHQVLDQGLVLAMFPEGHRSENRQLQRAHLGTALVAVRTGATILPIAIAGAVSGIGPLLRLQRPHIKLTFGQPFHLPVAAGSQMGKTQLWQLSDFMMYRIAELLPPEYRGVYADPNHPPTQEMPPDKIDEWAPATPLEWWRSLFGWKGASNPAKGG
jgi:1-acyl-sn-glycerol-3-phosphate acyltransferase